MKVEERNKIIIIDIMDCIRCGCNHLQLKFTILSNSPKGITHWSMCPMKNQPILKSELTK